MKLVILGQGSYSKTVADIAMQLGYVLLAMLDDKDLFHPLSSYAEYIANDVEFIPAFGNNAFRLEWLDRISTAGGRLATLIHPTAYISPTAVIEEGCVVLPKALINTDVIVKRGCIINLGAIIDHGCIIKEGCHICLGAIVKGENQIAALTKIEAGGVVQARTYPIEKR